MAHLTSAEIFAALGLRALWKAPDWALKVISVVAIIRGGHLDGPADDESARSACALGEPND
jgi:hypothetical protein